RNRLVNALGLFFLPWPLFCPRRRAGYSCSWPSRPGSRSVSGFRGDFSNGGGRRDIRVWYCALSSLIRFRLLLTTEELKPDERQRQGDNHTKSNHSPLNNPRVNRLGTPFVLGLVSFS